MPSLANVWPGQSASPARKPPVNASTGERHRRGSAITDTISIIGTESVGWRTLETRPGHYDFAPLASLCEKAASTSGALALDLLNFEWPDYLDITRSEFVDAFTDFADAAVQFLASQDLPNLAIVPAQQISLLAAAVGDFALLPPYLRSMGGLVQRQLAKAAIRASRLIRNTLPNASLLSVEPIFDTCENQAPSEIALAEGHHLRTLEIWDMLTGRVCPELGGRPELLDTICVRFLEAHPWAKQFARTNRACSRKRENGHRGSYHRALIDIHQRYGRPLLVVGHSKHLAIAGAPADFFDQELEAALQREVPILGLNFHSEHKSLESLAAALETEHAISQSVPFASAG